MGSVLKNTTAELDYGVSHENEKKSDDCALSETLNAPHFYRRRNPVCPLCLETILSSDLDVGMSNFMI